jgi:hypothetical protein
VVAGLVNTEDIRFMFGPNNQRRGENIKTVHKANEILESHSKNGIPVETSKQINKQNEMLESQKYRWRV